MSLRSERRYISINEVKSGMMLQFSYEKADGTTNNYMVLVIDPERTSDGAKEPQLHGYDIDNLTDYGVIRLLIDLKVPIIISAEDRRASMGDLASDEVYASFKQSEFYSARSYKKFNRSKLRRVQQVLLGELEDIPPVTEDVKIFKEESKRALLDALDKGKPVVNVPEVKAQLATQAPQTFVQLPGESIVAFERRKRAGRTVADMTSAKTQLDDSIGTIKRTFGI